MKKLVFVACSLVMCLAPAAEASEIERLKAEAKAAAKAADRTTNPSERAHKRTVALNAYAKWKAAEKGVVPVQKTLRLNSLFSDHAVLQRDMPIPVWGYTKPNSFVTVFFKGKSFTALANENGKFFLYLPPQEAGGPFTMDVFGDGESLTINDLYVGEVWVAGGQSNMEMPLTGYGVPVPKEDYSALGAKVPVRMFKVEKCNVFTSNEDAHSQWMTTWNGNEKIWSATAGFFAGKLARELNVPVGIVLCAYSGSKAEAWMSFGALRKSAALDTYLATYEWEMLPQMLDEDNRFAWSKIYGFADAPYSMVMRAIEKHYPKMNLNQPAEGREKVDFDDSSWQLQPVPGNWRSYKGHGWNGNGVVWYRKEIQIPEDWSGKDLVLSLGLIDKQDKTYFNGEKIGETGAEFDHTTWAVDRQYPVPARLVKGGKAVIAVRALSFADAGGFFSEKDHLKIFVKDAPQKSIALAGDWRAKLTMPADQREAGSRAWRHLPHLLSDNMLSTIIPYACRGAIWYQGESNVTGADYTVLMKELIGDWRARWNQKDFAFLQVILAGWDVGTKGWANGWPAQRARQIAAAKATGTGYASATDLGHQNIHPPYKKVLGERLALRALTDAYGNKTVVSRGPEAVCAVAAGDALVVTFDFAQGLKTAKGAPVGGVEVAGKTAHGRFFKAAAKLDGDRLVVSKPAELKADDAILRVRYAWQGYPADANLYNAADLPALPFDLAVEK